ncbi:MAG: hypothetical protein ACE5DI_00260 [Candidatus Micrarchaeia archaeon]
MTVYRRNLPLIDLAITFLDALYSAVYALLYLPVYFFEVGDYLSLFLLAGLLFLLFV